MSTHTSQFPEQPLNRIALAASGGGFRAAAYTLGTLSYLNRIQFKQASLLNRVSYVASVSGGAITTAFYGKSLVDGTQFDVFYRQMRSFLEKDGLLQEVYKVLQEDAYWQNSTKRRNLINAFAIVYDRWLSGLTLTQLHALQENTHLKEICFNATEFSKGLPFRFQTQQQGTSNRLGNQFLSVIPTNTQARQTANRMKVGDIIAAASCFPAGFEPILFPDDFTHENLTRVELEKAMTKAEPFGLMDGGITDNQAVGSVQLAQDRRQPRPNQMDSSSFDLLLVTDVSNLYSPTYVPTNEKKAEQLKGVRIGQFYRLLQLSPFLTVLSAVLLFVPNFWIHTIGALFILPSAIIWILTNWIRKGLRQLEANIVKNKSLSWKAVIEPYGRYFLNLPLSILNTMLSDRLNTVIILASDLFLKRIRRGDFERLFEDPAWRHRRASNFIYELSQSNRQNREERLGNDDWRGALKDSLSPSEKVEKMAETARLMSTTLWFDPAHEQALEAIIATGQFTTCYNLIQYLCRLERNSAYSSLPQVDQMHLMQLKTDLIADWQQFNQQPSRFV